MADSSHYMLERYFGAGRQDLIRYTPHAGFLQLEVVEAEPRRATLKIS